MRQSLYDKELENLQKLTEIRQQLWERYQYSKSVTIFDAHNKARIAELEAKSFLKTLIKLGS